MDLWINKHITMQANIYTLFIESHLIHSFKHYANFPKI